VADAALKGRYCFANTHCCKLVRRLDRLSAGGGWIRTFGSARDKLRFKALLARRCEHWGLARYLVSYPVAVDALRLQVSRIAILHRRQVAFQINDFAHVGVLVVLPVRL